MVVQKYGGVENTIILRPEPMVTHNMTGQQIASEGVPEDHPWWRNEGCADSIASVTTSAIFLAPFLFYWTVRCHAMPSALPFSP